MRALFVVLLLLVLGACSFKDFKMEEASPNILLKEAQAYLQKGDVGKSIGIFEKVNNLYSFTDESLQAQMMIIWLSYRYHDLAKAEVLTDEFIKYYPYNKYSYYVEYMQALIAYQQIPNYRRDLSQAFKTLNFFDQYIVTYPDTKYARDLLFKRVLVVNLLAQNSVDIAKYYLKHKVYEATIKRDLDVINKYPRSMVVPEALYQLVYANLAIGLRSEAVQYFGLLKYNYPTNYWYSEAKKLLEKYS